ncbi:DMT family transporter [Streptomyces pratens]|uniref:DMT family transporter n=1 Tax=Streptomyces pratens TaxID=887456 RepID=A0ABW1LTH2_9ACTN
MSALALSVLLSFVSAVAYAGGAIVQEQVAVSSPGEQYAPLRQPGWWAAVALNGLGGLLHVVALACGPLSLVQPLGALTIVFALPMAALFVGRRAGATAWRGALMATAGLAGLLSLVGASDAQSLGTAQRVAAALATAVAVVALMVAARTVQRHPAVRSILLAVASGIAFGMSSVFTKTVAVDWTDGFSAGDVPSLSVIGVLATAGLLLSQASYRGAGLAAPLATLTVVNPVVAAAVGITMFGETFRYGATGTALALSCGVVAAGGLILLTTERLAREQPQRVENVGAGAPGFPVTPVGPVFLEAPVAPVAPEVEVAMAGTVPAGRSVEAVAAVKAVGALESAGSVGAGAGSLSDSVERLLYSELARDVRVRVPAQATAATAATAGSAPEAGAEGEAAEPSLPVFVYGPFSGGSYVPMPAQDRHRLRVTS